MKKASITLEWLSLVVTKTLILRMEDSLSNICIQIS